MWERKAHAGIAYSAIAIALGVICVWNDKMNLRDKVLCVWREMQVHMY